MTPDISAWLAAFASALTRNAPIADLFAPDCYWRDLVAFTWNIRTLEGAGEIQAMLDTRLAEVQPRGFTPVEAEGGGWFTFETATGRGRGQVRLKDGKAHMLFTALRELKGFEEKAGPTREEGVTYGAVKGGKPTWAERRAAASAALGSTEQPFCLIVGGGQGGIGLAARLKRLDVPTLVVDALPRPGDAWRNRYKSLCLHDHIRYCHLPYLEFPEHWPTYMPKDMMGDWLEMYVRIMELDYWAATRCQSASYDEAAGEWTVQLDRNGTPVTLHPKHLILATGMSGVPDIPQIPGAERFLGQQHHSSAHRGGEDYAGKSCIVVGSNNSAHDIAADLWEQGAEVTMLQRSSTLVARAATLRRNFDKGPFGDAAVARGVKVDDADLLAATLPYKLWADVQRPISEQIQRDDAAYYDRLRKAGFLLDFGDDGSGLGLKYQRRGSGYYIDVGGSELVANGDIGLRSGVEIREIRERSVILTSGEELPADLIVYATGYGSMNGWAAQLISQEVADRVGKCWGLGSNTAKDPGPWEGELRNMWKPTQQPGLWFHGGNLAQSRHYSRYLALQLKARLQGLPTPVYGLAEVHHLS